MKSLSGDYPEVWIVYDRIDTITGETTRIYYLIYNIHKIIPALNLFKQRPPTLNDGEIGKVHEIHYWKSPTDIVSSSDFKFIWRTY